MFFAELERDYELRFGSNTLMVNRMLLNAVSNKDFDHCFSSSVNLPQWILQLVDNYMTNIPINITDSNYFGLKVAAKELGLFNLEKILNNYSKKFSTDPYIANFDLEMNLIDPTHKFSITSDQIRMVVSDDRFSKILNEIPLERIIDLLNEQDRANRALLDTKDRVDEEGARLDAVISQRKQALPPTTSQIMAALSNITQELSDRANTTDFDYGPMISEFQTRVRDLMVDVNSLNL